MLYSSHTMGSARRHRRTTAWRALPLALAGAVLLSCWLLTGSAGSASSSAQAAIALSGGSGTGQIAVDASATDNTSSAGGSSLAGIAFGGSPSATVASFVASSTLTSTATVKTGPINLLDGVVTAEDITVKATATATSTGTAASSTGSGWTNLQVQGVTGALPQQGPVVVPNVGTLQIMSSSVDSSRGSAQMAGLILTLSTATDGYPAGTRLIVGSVTVAADTATLAALIGTPTPTATPTPSITPSPTHTPKPTRTPTPTPSITYQPTATSPYPTSGSPIPGYTYSPMPTPSAAAIDILNRFPGAVFPVVGHYNYTDTFGAYRADMPSGHEGDDIFAAYGSPIVAVQDGTITGVDTTGIGGNNIHLTNARGDYFYYAHLSRFATGLQVGQQVVAGQTIGYVGNTGDAVTTPPHLHFEIHPDGGPAVDPTPYLDAWRMAGHVVTTGTSSGGQSVTSQFDPTVPSDGEGTATASVIDDGLQQAAASFAALQSSLTSGSRQSSGAGEAGVIGGVFVVLNTLGVVALKRLQLGALLLP